MTDNTPGLQPENAINSTVADQKVDKLTGLLSLNPDVKSVIERFDFLLTIYGNPQTVLERPHINIIAHGLQNKLDDKDISTISLYIKSKFVQNKMQIPTSKIQKILHEYLNATDNAWQGFNYVGQHEGKIFVETNKKTHDKLYVSNFTLEPLHTIVVDGGYKYHVYDVHILDDPNVYKLMLKSSDFNSLANLQEQIARQLAHTSAHINGCNAYMKDLFHKFVTLADWQEFKQGTSLLGLERLHADGPKYFGTPEVMYDSAGNPCNDIVYMGNEHTNQEEIKKLSNLRYEPDRWYKEIAPVVLKNIVKINDKNTMLQLVGWMGAIPHDYVIRKEAGTGFFPHCQIVGEPGAGKSTLLTLLKQFMGHNDAAPRTFPSAFELQKLLNSSYTIPVVLDEYGKRWSPYYMEAVNKILVESFTKASFSKGKSDQSSVYYKYKNPILFGGQIPVTDQALAERTIIISVYKFFQRTAAGKKAFEHMLQLRKLEDKNFWTGYNLWCAKHSNEEVEQQYEKYRSLCRAHILDNRRADICATIMLGLHYMRKLAHELGITDEELGYTPANIESMYQIFVSTTSHDDYLNPLHEFLRDLGQYGVSVGNSDIHGIYFGKGRAVTVYTPTNDGAGVYGATSKQQACVYGKELILIKIDEMVQVLNSRKKRQLYDYKEIMTFVDAEFKKSMQDPQSQDNLVLAPKQYRTRHGMYTAFSKEKLCSLHAEYDSIRWL